MIKSIFFSLIMVCWCGVSYAQVDLKVLGSLPPVLKETSGLAITKNGNLWTIVDGKYPVLYNLSLTGEVKKVIYLNHKNQDWEELTTDDTGNFYIGSFGNNKNDRRDLKIFKLPPPDSITENFLSCGVIRFHYADQKSFPPPPQNMNYDMEAMIHFNNHLYLFSKNRTRPFTGYTKMYRLPDAPGDYVAELADSVYLGHGTMLDTWVTGAALSPDKKTLLLLSHDKVWLFTCFTSDRFLKGKMTTLQLNNFSQKEGICFKTNTELYVTDELTHNILGGNLYMLTLPKNFGEVCK